MNASVWENKKEMDWQVCSEWELGKDILVGKEG